MPEQTNYQGKILQKPYTEEQIKSLMDEDCYVEGLVTVPLSCIIHNDCEEFLDLISRKLVGHDCLMDITYNAVGVDDITSGDTDIILQVKGCVETEEE